jgi:hypothetical protein
MMFTMLAMPRRAADKTKPISLRFDKQLLSELLALGEQAEYRPTLTQLLESAVREYVDARRHRREQPKSGKR